MAKYDLDNYGKLFEFTAEIPEDRAQFKSVLIEVQLVTSMALQASLDVASNVVRTTATAIVMRRASWLLSSGIVKELQVKVEDLPFNKEKLFSEKTEVLHTMKDFRVTLHMLGIYTLHPKKKRY